MRKRPSICKLNQVVEDLSKRVFNDKQFMIYYQIDQTLEEVAKCNGFLIERYNSLVAILTLNDKLLDKLSTNCLKFAVGHELSHPLKYRINDYMMKNQRVNGVLLENLVKDLEADRGIKEIRDEEDSKKIDNINAIFQVVSQDTPSISIEREEYCDRMSLKINNYDIRQGKSYLSELRNLCRNDDDFCKSMINKRIRDLSVDL